MNKDELIDKCAQLSLLGHPKLGVLYKHLSLLPIPEGDVVELGVYKGGSAMLLAEIFPHKRIYLYDTFSGMPFTVFEEIHKEGDFSDTSLLSVKESLKDYTNLVFVPGFFPDTAKDYDGKVAVAFCDGDYYQSTKDFIDFYWPKLSKGGIMVFDDYNWVNCPGVKQAIIDSPCLLNQTQWQEDFLYFVIKEAD